MVIQKMLYVNLFLFGEGAGGDGGGTTAQGEVQGTVPDSTHRGNTGDNSKVVYGKQPVESGSIETNAADVPAAGEQEKGKAQTTSNTMEERRRAYYDLINGEYKDLYTADTQRMIDRRFRETKTMEGQISKQQPVMELLFQRYGVTDGDVDKVAKALEADNSYWSHAAEEAGMTVEQFKELSRLQRENKALMELQQRRQNQDAALQTIQKWTTEAEAMREKYPGFDLNRESENPEFVSLLKSGVPVEHAYRVLHLDEIVNAAVVTSEAMTEKRVVDNVRAKGARPVENGTASQSGFIVKDDVSKLTKKDRADIARRVMRGEMIGF